MAPYNFDAPETDTILRSSDGKEFHVHRLILSLASTVFQGMFSLPQQPTESLSPIDIPESSDILQPFLQYLYPQLPPKIEDLTMWEALYTIADKYIAGVVMRSLQDILRNRFLAIAPLRVYALASRWGLENVAKFASTKTLNIDIFKGFSKEDADLMGGVACQQLYLLHFNRREAIRNIVINQPIPSQSILDSCRCDTPDYSRLLPALGSIVGKTHWLTVEMLYEASSCYYPVACGDECRNAFKNARNHFTSILKVVSKLPHTI